MLESKKRARVYLSEISKPFVSPVRDYFQMAEAKGTGICIVTLAVTQVTNQGSRTRSSAELIEGTVKDAIAEGLALAKEVWPPAEGYSGHQAVAVQMTYQTARAIAIKMLEREDFRAELWSAMMTIKQKPAKR